MYGKRRITLHREQIHYHMELKQIISFYYVAETLNFSHAARLACITQSAISQHVKALETELGAILIDRNIKPMQLTESGEILFSHAKKIIKESQAIVDDITSLTSELHGTLRIGVGAFISSFVRHCAKEMMRRYPKVKIIVHFNDSRTLNRKLRNHEIDLAFTLNMSEPEEGIESMPCIPLSLKAIMSRTHSLANKEFVTYEDVKAWYVILPDAGKRVYATIKQIAPFIDLNELKTAAIVNSPTGLLEMVSESNYITFMPDLSLSHYPELVAKSMIDFPKETFSNAHWMKDAPMKQTMTEFLNIMSSYTIPYYKSLNQE